MGKTDAVPMSGESECSINIRFANNGIVVSGHKYGPKASKDLTYVYDTLEKALTAIPNIHKALKE